MRRKARKYPLPILKSDKMMLVKYFRLDNRSLILDWNYCKKNCEEQGCFLCKTNHKQVKEILTGYYGNYKKDYQDCILYKTYLIVYKYAGRIRKTFEDRQQLIMYIRERVRREMVATYRQYVRNGYWDTFWFLSGRCPRCEDPKAVEGKCNIPHGVRENARCIYSFGINPSEYISEYRPVNKFNYGFILLLKRR